MRSYQLKQSVTEVGQGFAAGSLLRGQRPLLSAWYGQPLSRGRAATLHAVAQRELQVRLRKGASCFQIHVLQLVCHFRHQTGSVQEYEKMQMVATDAFELALLELVYGQLLMSCKQVGAHQHLADGFALAVDHLASDEYFQLLRQHELLGWLPLSETPSLPQKLASLLAEAAVIRQLQGGVGMQYRSTHLDTLG